MIDMCKYLGVIVVIFITILIISRSLNWQSNILKFMTLREGMKLRSVLPKDEDDDEEDEEDEQEEEFNVEDFDAEDFREKLRDLLDLSEEMYNKHGKAYGAIIPGYHSTKIMRGIAYVKGLWDEKNDEWKKKAFSELAESKFLEYNEELYKLAKYYDNIIEKADTKDSYKEQYDDLKKIYGVTGVTYIKRIVGIILDKEMDLDMELDMELDTNYSGKSGSSFFS